MAKIIKTELHPNGDKRVTLYPKTSIDQIEGYVEKDVDLYEHNISYVFIIGGNAVRVYTSLINRSSTLFNYDSFIEFLKNNKYTSNHEFPAFGSYSSTYMNIRGVYASVTDNESTYVSYFSNANATSYAKMLKTNFSSFSDFVRKI